MLAGKKIIIGITGSIAAYKIPFLIRLLKKAGAEVQVIMTPAAKDFVTPLTLSTLSERPVLIEFFDTKDGLWSSHVELGLWADMLIVAPVTANTLAKMASGIADNLLLTTMLSARCQIVFAPAMDLDMYQHPTTTENIKKLQSFGYKLIKPVKGELASGLEGFGRLEEPENIKSFIEQVLCKPHLFSGKKVLITAGPTFEAIDPVRFIGNRSSGKMGHAIALAFADQGAEVKIITGPTCIETNHKNISVIKVERANEMHAECLKVYADTDIVVMSAAVADFAPVSAEKQKIKKEHELKQIELKPTVDILAELGDKKLDGQILVGFALETDNETANARKKMSQKNLDIIVLNSLKDTGAGFGYDTNKVTILAKGMDDLFFDLKSKDEVALDLLEVINKIGK